MPEIDTEREELSDKDFINQKVIPNLNRFKEKLERLQKQIEDMLPDIDDFIEECQDQTYEISEDDDHISPPPLPPFY